MIQKTLEKVLEHFSKFHLKILLDINAQWGERIFQTDNWE